MHLPWVAVLVLLLQATEVSADSLPDGNAETAKSVALAELVPQTCNGFQTDREAVASLLEHAGMTGRDVTDRYADEALAAEDQFTAAAQRDRDVACRQAWGRLGDKGLGLLVPRE